MQEKKRKIEWWINYRKVFHTGRCSKGTSISKPGSHFWPENLPPPPSVWSSFKALAKTRGFSLRFGLNWNRKEVVTFLLLRIREQQLVQYRLSRSIYLRVFSNYSEVIGEGKWERPVGEFGVLEKDLSMRGLFWAFHRIIRNSFWIGGFGFCSLIFVAANWGFGFVWSACGCCPFARCCLRLSSASPQRLDPFHAPFLDPLVYGLWFTVQVWFGWGSALVRSIFNLQ